MNAPEPVPASEVGKVGTTACGGTITVTADTPFTYYRDEIVYFCNEDCLKLYKEDPLNSCMAARILMGR